ncbi:Soluble lamin-associated protein of 75 kDa [Nipponia nippon]|uniref:Soluble lamin-associated protein of 75 kDa n=1 Tax=Nipponia nippon TaxID=128390 RepID=A0A091UN50_NIPNI|nr:Soluble lamin-associated protein of 75 kDa [Nipponia nippon]
MAFPVDMLNSHEDLESSAEDYLSDLRCGDPNCPEFLSLPDHGKIPISLSTVGFVPLYGGEQTHKVLALFAPEDSLTGPNIALAKVTSHWVFLGFFSSLSPFLSSPSCFLLFPYNAVYMIAKFATNACLYLNMLKSMRQHVNADVLMDSPPIISGSICSSSLTQSYQLPVLDTMFVRKKHRGKDFGLIMLEDFVDSFTEDTLGLRYPLSSFMYIACKHYFEKYPGDHELLWEVEGAGHWFQRTPITTVLQREKLKIAEVSQKENTSFQAEDYFRQSAAESEESGQKTELEIQLSVDPDITPVSIRIRSSHLKHPRIGKNSQESEPETSKGNEENVLHVSESRLELPAHTFESSEDLVEEPEENAVANDEEMIVENKDRSVSEMELHASPPEKWSEKEETPSEPLNGEVTEEIGKIMAEEETENEVLGGESKLQSESQGEEPLTLFVPLILESPAKPSEDTVSEVLNANDSEVLTEESTSVEEGTEEHHQESEKKLSSTENAAASARKEEPSDSGLPNSMVIQAAEESVSENVLPKTASSVEDQNEEAGHDSQKAPVALSRSSLIVVELEGVSFQQPSGQEVQKNQLEEHSEESAEQMDQYTQTVAERAADSSSEEAEIEVPIVDRRNLRRKAKGYKGPPKKKGKLA